MTKTKVVVAVSILVVGIALVALATTSGSAPPEQTHRSGLFTGTPKGSPEASVSPGINGASPSTSPSPESVDPADLPARSRSNSLFPEPEELRLLQKQASSQGNSDLTDPVVVATLYLKDRLAETEAARRGVFGKMTRDPIDSDFVHVLFEGTLDVQPGKVTLVRYGFPYGKPNDVWYVVAANSNLFGAGGEFGEDSYHDGKLRQTYIPDADGTAEVIITDLEEGRILYHEMLDIRNAYLVEIEQTFDQHYRIHIQVRFHSADGRWGITEFTS